MQSAFSETGLHSLRCTSTSRHLSAKDSSGADITRADRLRYCSSRSQCAANKVLERHSTVELPLLGRIAAGRPLLEAVEEHETLSLGEFARSDKTFVLQVKGSSMIEDHIMNGDYVVVEPTQVANPGEIVVALVGENEATLKRFYRESGGKIRLQPANSEIAPIVVPAADVKIQGRVVGVLRKY